MKRLTTWLPALLIVGASGVATQAGWYVFTNGSKQDYDDKHGSWPHDARSKIVVTNMMAIEVRDRSSLAPPVGGNVSGGPYHWSYTWTNQEGGRFDNINGIEFLGLMNGRHMPGAIVRFGQIPADETARDVLEERENR